MGKKLLVLGACSAAAAASGGNRMLGNNKQRILLTAQVLHRRVQRHKGRADRSENGSITSPCSADDRERRWWRRLLPLLLVRMWLWLLVKGCGGQKEFAGVAERAVASVAHGRVARTRRSRSRRRRCSCFLCWLC
jgi:hypothetical protein